MRWWKRAVVCLALLGVASSCKQTPTDFDTFEREYVVHQKALADGMRASGLTVDTTNVPTSYRAVYVGASGVWIDRTLIAALPEMERKRAEIHAALDRNATLMPTIGYSGLMVTFDVEAQSAGTTVSAMQLFADREVFFNIRRRNPDAPQMATERICTTKLRDKITPPKDDEAINLSLLVEKDRTWVGISTVNEFQEVPRGPDGHDWMKVKSVLHEYKASVFFANRNDMEIAVADGTGLDVMNALALGCNVRFHDMAFVKREQLSAIPKL